MLHAQIYSVYDAPVWEFFKPMHKNRTHAEEIARIAGFLRHEAIIRIPNVSCETYVIRNGEGAFRYPEYFLGRYERAELCFAVKIGDIFNTTGVKKIKCYSTDFITEKILSSASNPVGCAELREQVNYLKRSIDERTNNYYQRFFGKPMQQFIDSLIGPLEGLALPQIKGKVAEMNLDTQVFYCIN